MIAGKTVGEPKTRDTKSGGKVTFFRMRVANGAACEFWDIATFADDCRAELDGLPEGFPLCATGEFSVEPWEKDGKRGFNLRMTASTITRLSGKKRTPRPATPKPTGRDVVRRSWAAPASTKGAQDDDAF